MCNASQVLTLLVVVGISDSALAQKEAMSSLPKEARDLLAGALEVEVISVDPEVEPPPGKPAFRGRSVLGSTGVTDKEDRAKLVKEVTDAVERSPWSNIGLCFRPRHGVRVKSKDRVLEIAICYECHRVEVFVNDERIAVESTQESSEKLLDSILTRAKIPLATKPQKKGERR
jgi:hypothetical protein